MRRRHKAMNNIIEDTAEVCRGTLEREAKEVLRRCRSLRAFNASMGTACFYDKDNYPIYEDALPKLARNLLEMEEDYCRHFGSPNIHIERDNSEV